MLEIRLPSALFNACMRLLEPESELNRLISVNYLFNASLFYFSSLCLLMTCFSVSSMNSWIDFDDTLSPSEFVSFGRAESTFPTVAIDLLKELSCPVIPYDILACLEILSCLAMSLAMDLDDIFLAAPSSRPRPSKPSSFVLCCTFGLASSTCIF